jgi:hypothetical protein
MTDNNKGASRGGWRDRSKKPFKELQLQSAREQGKPTARQSGDQRHPDAIIPQTLRQTEMPDVIG